MGRRVVAALAAFLVLGAACSQDSSSDEGAAPPGSEGTGGTRRAAPPLAVDPAGPVRIALTGDTATVHDPAVGREGDTYHLFFTGGAIQHRTSDDLTHWETAPPVLEELPSWIAAELPGASPDLWAPDVSWWGGQWHLYYSTSVWADLLPTRNSAIGHATSASLDPASPDHGWTDHGAVVRSRGEALDEDRSGWNAIDPAVVLDEDGAPWLAWGSSYDGLFLQPLEEDGTLDESVPPVNLARREGFVNVVEAPTLVERDGWWYLFASYDLCCAGMRATYNVRVGRARELTGPYVDREGRPLAEGGGTKVLTAYDGVRGPGHQTIVREGDSWWLVHHWYDPARDGARELGIRPLDWDDDGWPVARGWSPAIALPPPLGGHD